MPRTSAWGGGRVAIGMAAVAAALLAPAGGVALAQEQPTYEQLRKNNEDAQRELRAAQDRKNQLAAEAEELKKQLAAANQQLEELRRTDAEHAERTFYLRSHYAAWHAFIRRRPELQQQWRAYLGDDLIAAPRDPVDIMDPDWPMSYRWPTAGGRTPSTAPATTPATAPSTAATTPATVPSTWPATIPATVPTTPSVPVAPRAPTPSHTQPAAAPATPPSTQPATPPAATGPATRPS